MFFYNLANANLAQSYHLMMLGPEDSYCARGDVLEIPHTGAEWLYVDRRPDENNFKCERLRGQRHAHVLWGKLRTTIVRPLYFTTLGARKTCSLLLDSWRLCVSWG